MSLPYATNTGSRNENTLFAKFVAGSLLSISRIIKGDLYYSFFYFRSNTVLRIRFAPADFCQGFFSSCFKKLFNPVKTVTTGTHHFAGLSDIVQVFG